VAGSEPRITTVADMAGLEEGGAAAQAVSADAAAAMPRPAISSNPLANSLEPLILAALKDRLARRLSSPPNCGTTARCATSRMGTGAAGRYATVARLPVSDAATMVLEEAGTARACPTRPCAATFSSCMAGGEGSLVVTRVAFGRWHRYIARLEMGGGRRRCGSGRRAWYG